LSAPTDTISRYQVTLRTQTLRTADFFPAVAVNTRGAVAIAYQRTAGAKGEIRVVESRDFGQRWYDAEVAAARRGQVFSPSISFSRPDRLGTSRVGLMYYNLVKARVSLWSVAGVAVPDDVTLWPRHARQLPPTSLGSIPQVNRFLGDYHGLTPAPKYGDFVAANAWPLTSEGDPTEIRAGTFRP
jgi:hypothetical protein